MNSRWNERDAAKYAADPLQMRVYTSRLLGQDDALVLQGGGNTSVKAKVTNLLGDVEDALYVKGSGWDLATIEAAGFAPVRLDVLRRMAELDALGDRDMVRMQRSAMLDPAAPTPSVEAILHAIIPSIFVDHTHADAVVLVTNTEDGEDRIRRIYGDCVLVVPYVMPGFALAKKVYAMTRRIDWRALDGMVLMNHGVFTFADSARESYERMIHLVTKAEEYASRDAPRTQRQRANPSGSAVASSTALDLASLARVRRAVSTAAGHAMLARLDAEAMSRNFCARPDVASAATRGPLTPDHVIRTKRVPLIVDGDIDAGVEAYAAGYRAYFERNTNGGLAMLDPAPRWAVWPPHGTVVFGRTVADLRTTGDIGRHTMAAIETAESLGGWRPLSEKQIFDVEYWELEQAKLKKATGALPLAGKVALVTGAASGIGLACAERLLAEGAAVVGLDIAESVVTRLDHEAFRGRACDVTQPEAVAEALAEAVREFGGVDILISNAGAFPGSEDIAAMRAETWRRTLDLNLTSHQQVLQACVPYLALGVDSAVVVVGSKNVPAPGRGQASYSVAKAGLTQLARVAALELGSLGIRVNIVHPNNVFDTALWTPQVIEDRARRSGQTVEEYRTSNVLRVDVTSNDVAAMVCAMVGPAFAKTTGAQVPVDGGNDRVI
jgi:rhamnose utilization protein RhaD (predicted bifunctional aldolase and dehydrogenase)/NAD(P)-dependent dehydrogenase (short-subunit alcohol dehydrogenase family)